MNFNTNRKFKHFIQELKNFDKDPLIKIDFGGNGIMAGVHKEGILEIVLFGIGTYDIHSRLSNKQFLFIESLFEKYKNECVYSINLLDESPNLELIYHDFLFLKKKYDIEKISFTGPDFGATEYIKKISNKNDVIPYVSNYNMINHAGKKYPNEISINRKYFSTLLLRRFGVERLIFAYELYKKNYFNTNSITNIFAPYAENQNTELAFEEGELIKTIYDLNTKYNLNYSDLEKFIEVSKIGTDTQSEGLVTVEQTRSIPKNNDSYFWVSIETTLDNDIIFITEKILKAFLYNQIPLVVMNAGSYKFLKDVGFEMDFDGIDTSFLESNINDLDKIKKMARLVSELSKLSSDEIRELFLRNVKKVEKNKHLVLSLTDNDNINEYIRYNDNMMYNNLIEKSEASKFKKIFKINLDNSK